MTPQQLAKILKTERLRQGRTVKGVAEAAGVHENTIRQWEQGKRLGTVQNVFRALSALQATVSIQTHPDP